MSDYCYGVKHALNTILSHLYIFFFKKQDVSDNKGHFGQILPSRSSRSSPETETHGESIFNMLWKEFHSLAEGSMLPIQPKTHLFDNCRGRKTGQLQLTSNPNLHSLPPQIGREEVGSGSAEKRCGNTLSALSPWKISRTEALGRPSPNLLFPSCVADLGKDDSLNCNGRHEGQGLPRTCKAKGGKMWDFLQGSGGKKSASKHYPYWPLSALPFIDNVFCFYKAFTRHSCNAKKGGKTKGSNTFKQNPPLLEKSQFAQTSANTQGTLQILS